jgi:hypothetical protein
MPDAFPAYDSITGAIAMDCSGEIETVVYKKKCPDAVGSNYTHLPLQGEKDHVSQYCNHWSLAGVLSYIGFREP